MVGASPDAVRPPRLCLWDLVGFDRAHLVADVLLGFALVPIGLAFIFGGVYATGWFVYGSLTPPYLFGPPPLPAALYGVLPRKTQITRVLGSARRELGQ